MPGPDLDCLLPEQSLLDGSEALICAELHASCAAETARALVGQPFFMSASIFSGAVTGSSYPIQLPSKGAPPGYVLLTSLPIISDSVSRTDAESRREMLPHPEARRSVLSVGSAAGSCRANIACLLHNAEGRPRHSYTHSPNARLCAASRGTPAANHPSI